MRYFLKLFRGAGLLNLFGMTVAFASLYILIVQVNYDLGYNHKIKDVERIYIMSSPSWFEAGKYSVSFNRPIPKAILEQASMVESYGVAYIGDCKTYLINVGEGDNAREYKIGTSQMTRGALDVFGYEPIAGTFDGMDKTASVAISEKAAKLMDVGVGDAIKLGRNMVSYTVTSVYRNMPMNSDLNNIDAIYCNNLERESENSWGEWSYNHFVKLNSSLNKEAFEEHAFKVLTDLVLERVKSAPESEILTDEEVRKYINNCKVTLQPVKDMFYNKLIYVPAGRVGNKTTTITLMAVAILIVIITLINFVNFFFAQIPERIRSVNTRKILGSSRTSLIGGFLLESGILVIISLLAAMTVIELFRSSTYANLISCSLAFGDNLFVLMLTFIAAAIMTIASGVYPAVYITSFSPALAIKGVFGITQSGKVLRYSLIGLQFIISLSFVICSLFIKKQHSFMMDYDMGFNKEYLLTTTISINNNREALSEELLKSPYIKDIAWAAGPLVKATRMAWGRPFKDEIIHFDAYPVSWNFLSFMGIDIIEGRDFLQSDEKGEGVFIFNQTAKNKFNLTLEDKVSGHRAETEIAGFCEDFQFKPLQYSIAPFAFYIFGKNPWWELSQLYIRVNAGTKMKDVVSFIKETVASVAPEYDVQGINVQFFDEELGRQYTKEKNLSTIITMFTIIAIIISLMGVLGLVIFEARYRRKEIGVRRVHGATVAEILGMFNLKFIKILLVCFVVSAPLSYMLMERYLSTFAYRTSMSFWVFAVSFVLVAAIVTAVVTVCSFKSATENPVDSLRNE